MPNRGPVRLTLRYPSRIRVDEDIELRLIDEGDARSVFALTDRNRAYLRRWLPWVDGTRTVEDTAAFIERSREQARLGQGFQAVILLHGEIVGVIGFVYVDLENRRAEIGYWIGEAYQGRGIMTRACRALVDFAFASQGMNRVEIRADVENGRSRAIPERLGFVQEAVLRQAGWMYDHAIDLVMYAMLHRDWRPSAAAGPAKP